MDATSERAYRIGDLARAAGTSPRTIRYYEERGLLPAPEGHAKGRHRNYGDADVARLRELIRLRDLLGVSLEELKDLFEAEGARAALRERFHKTDDLEQRRAILEQGLVHVEAQLALVHRRQQGLNELARELTVKRQRLLARLARPGRRSRSAGAQTSQPEG
jgi:DNA-binding transcriptional MerR regulator